MKKLLLLTVAFASFSAAAFADEYVNGYYRRNGTYVQGYERSSPNNTVTDNYSYRGNTNPYTGEVGTNSYPHDTTSPYYQGPDSNGNVGHSGNSDYNNYYR